MNPVIFGTALQMEIHRDEFPPENSEEYAQRHGRVVILPTLVDRLILGAGSMLIALGKRLEAAGTRRLHLNGELS
jgi:hypothetical protein